MTSLLRAEPGLEMAPAPSVLPGVVAASVGVSVPERVVSNAEIGARLGVEDDWIVRRTGIHSRRHSDPGERLADHAVRCARQALARAERDPCEVDLVIAATSTSDELM